MSNFKTAMVILAAGSSSRMGECKFLLKNHNQISFLESEIESSLLLNINRLVVVTSKLYECQVNEIIKKINSKIIDLVINLKPQKERFYSLQCGLNKIIDFDYCFVHNADNPFINLHTCNKLLENGKNADVLIPTFNNKGGHPILINNFSINYLLKLKWDSNLKEVIKNLKSKRIETNDPCILTNIDTVKDYDIYLENNLTQLVNN